MVGSNLEPDFLGRRLAGLQVTIMMMMKNYNEYDDNEDEDYK